MSVRSYDKEEKQAYVEDYKSSGENISRYALEKEIPESTLRGWLKEDENLSFGAIEIKPKISTMPKILKNTVIFATENIRIELKEGFDKVFLRRIVEVLINDN